MLRADTTFEEVGPIEEVAKAIAARLTDALPDGPGECELAEAVTRYLREYMLEDRRTQFAVRAPEIRVIDGRKQDVNLSHFREQYTYAVTVELVLRVERYASPSPAGA